MVQGCGSDDFLAISLDLLLCRHKAIEKQAKKGDVGENEQQHVHALVMTCSLINRILRSAYP